MAGSFGFERDHYDISMQIGERRLLPLARQAAAETLLIADGFSCKTQIEQAGLVDRSGALRQAASSERGGALGADDAPPTPPPRG